MATIWPVCTENLNPNVVVMKVFGTHNGQFRLFNSGNGVIDGEPGFPLELLRVIEAAKERDKINRAAEVARKVILDRMKKLTPRERQVLDFVIKGLLNKQIGSALGIHEKTIKVHRARVFQKMGVKTVAELVRMTVGISEQTGTA